MTQQPPTPAGWYPQGDGQQRYWDGYRWTDQVAPGPMGGPGPGYVPSQMGGPAPMYGAPGTAPSSSRKGCWIAAIVVLVLVLGGLATCTVVVKRAADGLTSAQHTVLYEVSGTGSGVSISYSEGSGGTSRVSDASLPWSKTVTTTGFSFLLLSATNSYTSSGTVACKITVDGKVVKEASGSGKGGTASCSYAG